MAGGCGAPALCAGAAAAVAVMLIGFPRGGTAGPLLGNRGRACEHGAVRGPDRLRGQPPVSSAAATERAPGQAGPPATAGGDPGSWPRAGSVRRGRRRLAYARASQHGALSVVSAVSSLYPVTTIALGVAIQRQRPNRMQVAGIILALLGAAVLGAATG